MQPASVWCLFAMLFLFGFLLLTMERYNPQQFMTNSKWSETISYFTLGREMKSKEPDVSKPEGFNQECLDEAMENLRGEYVKDTRSYHSS